MFIINRIEMDFEDECSPPFLIELNPSRTLSSFVFPAMRAFEEEKKNTQTFLRQARACQDFVKTGKSGNMTWLLVCDGHGTNPYIDWIRTLDWKTIATESDPVKTVCDLYEKSAIYVQTKEALLSGCTFSMARILENPQTKETLVECINVGDSKTMVFINGELNYMNVGHTAENPDEVERLLAHSCSTSTRPRILNDTKPKVLSENRITYVNSKMVKFSHKLPRVTKAPLGIQHSFDNNETLVLVPCQSLGHLGVTGIKPEKHTVHCYRTDNIRVLVCSDGISDMICFENGTDMATLAKLSADEIGQMIGGRWGQRWQYIDPKTDRLLGVTSFNEDGHDDMSVAIWDKKSE